MDVRSAITRTVPITVFNRGQAGKVFEEVRSGGARVVMKNNAAECVLLSPEEYVRLLDELNDAKLLLLANERLARADSRSVLSEASVLAELGISEEDLEASPEVALE